MKPVDGGAAWCAHVSPQLSRVLPFLQKHLGCPLERGVGVTWAGGGAGSLSAAHPPQHPVSTQASWPPPHADPPLLHIPRAVQQGLTSRVWAAMRWARPLGMPILTAPSAKASEKAHTCSSGEGAGVKASPPWDSAPSLEKAGNLQNKAQGTSHQSQGRSPEVSAKGPASKAQEGTDVGWAHMGS